MKDTQIALLPLLWSYPVENLWYENCATHKMDWLKRIQLEWNQGMKQNPNVWRKRRNDGVALYILYTYCIIVRHAYYLRAEDGLRMFVCMRAQQFYNKKLILALKFKRRIEMKRKKKNKRKYVKWLGFCGMSVYLLRHSQNAIKVQVSIVRMLSLL